MLKEIPSILAGSLVALVFGAALVGGQIEDTARDSSMANASSLPQENIKSEISRNIPRSNEIALNQSIQRHP